MACITRVFDLWDQFKIKRPGGGGWESPTALLQANLRVAGRAALGDLGKRETLVILVGGGWRLCGATQILDILGIIFIFKHIDEYG